MPPNEGIKFNVCGMVDDTVGRWFGEFDSMQEAVEHANEVIDEGHGRLYQEVLICAGADVWYRRNKLTAWYPIEQERMN